MQSHITAKLARGRHLLDEDEENDALMKRTKAKRRSSIAQESVRKMASTGVNTSSRRVSSAGSPGTLPKSTSTSDLQKVGKARALADERMEQIIREEIQKAAMAKLELSSKPSKKANKEVESNTNTSVERSSEEKASDKEDGTPHDYLDIDEEFEELPAISDTSDEDYDEDENRLNNASVELHKDKQSSSSEEGKRQKENVVYMNTRSKRSQIGEKPNKAENKRAGTRIISNKTKRSTNDSGKVVRMKGERKERKVEVSPHTLIHVQGLYDSGDLGDYEVYEDDWEEIGANR
ncbi:unnamed protein product, partial [Strongylus vulgaris]